VFENLKSSANGVSKRILELDIEKCFDRISHSTIMENLIAPSGLKLGIFRCLKAGITPEFPEQGTCQGGVVSPLLANIALNGIEDCHKTKDTQNKMVSHAIRYADDMVIILKPMEQCYTDSVQFTHELNSNGQYLGAAPLHSVAMATSVRVRDGKKLVTDGPFAETREQLGGYFLIEAQDLDEAIEIAERIPSARKGTVEIRPIFELAGKPPDK
jgi:hypothetical protein